MFSPRSKILCRTLFVWSTAGCGRNVLFLRACFLRQQDPRCDDVRSVCRRTHRVCVKRSLLPSSRFAATSCAVCSLAGLQKNPGTVPCEDEVCLPCKPRHSILPTSATNMRDILSLNHSTREIDYAGTGSFRMCGPCHSCKKSMFCITVSAAHFRPFFFPKKRNAVRMSSQPILLLLRKNIA